MTSTTFSPLVSSERAGAMLGVPGRFEAATVKPGQAAGLFFRQVWISEARPVSGYVDGASLRVEVRFDDYCGNGRNSFGITGDVRDPSKRGERGWLAGGCLHEDIAAVFPELAPLIGFHLSDTAGPMHYAANAVYLAGDRDHNGLRKDETRPRTTRDGSAMWELVAIASGPRAEGLRLSDTPTGREYIGAETVPLFILTKTAQGERPPVTPQLEWRQVIRVGKGKARDLDGARIAANWPDATDEELMQEPAQLREVLAQRLPALQAAFRAAMIGAGFYWTPELAREAA